MTAEFDWSGAPEGERWVWCDVRLVTDGQRSWVHAYGEWQPSVNSADFIREHGTRVESARPVPRVGDRVRVSVEGVVGAVYGDNLDLIVATDGRRETFFLTAFDPVEVLQRADPPLQPGNLVRAGGAVWQYTQDGRFSPVLDTEGDAAWDSSYRTRDDLTGPLVKVQLTEVPSE